MKKIFITILLSIIIVNGIQAQEMTKSYSCVGVMSSMGVQAPPSGMATWIEFYDDYIMVMGVEEFTYGGRNPDGSLKYLATKQGPPALNTIGWVITSDYSNAKQVIQSTVMGMTMQMEYHFSYIGEGSNPAQNMLGSSGYSGGYSGGNSGSSHTQCLSCYGSGSCQACGGTGQSMARGGKCHACDRTGNGKCAGCHGKGYY